MMIWVLALLLGAGDEWPAWRGPARDGLSRETDWSSAWPEGGPPVLWRAQAGTGFSSLVVAGGRAFTMGHADGKDVVHAFDAETGEARWTHAYPAEKGPNLFEGGPCSTPTVHGDRVYTISRWGDVFCFEAATGKVVWSVNVHKDGGVKIPTWGFAGSPVVSGDLLLLNGGEGGLALDRATGRRVWASDVEGEAGYSTPLPIGGGLAVFSTGESYVAAEVATGRERWRIPWITRYGVNAADPVVADGLMLVSSGYAKGVAVFRLGEGEPAPVWQSKVLRTQMNPGVLVDGILYAVDGDRPARQAPTLKAVELATGKVRWTHEGLGAASLTGAGGRLLILSEEGELLAAPASPERFEATARAKILTGKCWTVPVLANGRVYLRNAAGEVAAVDLRPRK